MRVLLLGGTGSVGAAILDELLSHDHSVLALARADGSAREMAAKGAEILKGDLRRPKDWASAVKQVDAVVHAAATFTQDMGEVDRRLVQALITEAKSLERALRFIYTGGVWLYGETKDRVADESSPFEIIPAFRWASDNYDLLCQADCFAPNMIHPAMVYERDGGVLSRFLSGARDRGKIEVWGTPETRWPLVHRQDLASAYRLVLERAPAGETFNVAAQQGIPVARIAQAIARRFGPEVTVTFLPRAEAMKVHGAVAEGPSLDQQMSSDKIRQSLGWTPRITDALKEIGPR